MTFREPRASGTTGWAAKTTTPSIAWFGTWRAKPGYDSSWISAPAELIISDARNVLNFDRPIAVMFMGVLGHAASLEAARRLTANYEKTGAVPYVQRGIEQIGQHFEGLEMVCPGLVSITQWRPDPSQVGTVQPLGEATGGVAQNP